MVIKYNKDGQLHNIGKIYAWNGKSIYKIARGLPQHRQGYYRDHKIIYQEKACDVSTATGVFTTGYDYDNVESYIDSYGYHYGVPKCHGIDDIEQGSLIQSNTFVPPQESYDTRYVEIDIPMRTLSDYLNLWIVISFGTGQLHKISISIVNHEMHQYPTYSLYYDGELIISSRDFWYVVRGGINIIIEPELNLISLGQNGIFSSIPVEIEDLRLTSSVSMTVKSYIPSSDGCFYTVGLKDASIKMKYFIC